MLIKSFQIITDKARYIYFFFFLFAHLYSCNQSTRQQYVEQKEDSIPVSAVSVPRKVTLLFVGDFMQHQTQINAARSGEGYDYSDYFKYVKEEITSVDIAIGNLEVTLAGKPYSGYPRFSAPDEYLYAIKDADFDVLSTANNHCLDRGKKGLERTILMLDSLNIKHLGTYRDSSDRTERYPLLLEKNGIRIALLSYTYGTNGLDPLPPVVVNYIDKEQITADINKAHTLNPDVIIAFMHWGEEYHAQPSGQQKELADWLFQQGVNHIIGAHPHVVQPLKVRKDSLGNTPGLLAYSLGNFISNQSDPGTDGGIMLKMTLEKDSITYMTDYSYSLIWTLRPIQSGMKNFMIIPAASPRDSIRPAATNTLERYIKRTRNLFDKHNEGIKEYTF